MKVNLLQAPFPYFGGKSSVAKDVWARLGDTPSYVEPFFGSGAMLLARPEPGKIETVNDKDGFVANFWRAICGDPETVAHHADNPVFENDLHARHIWLAHQADGLQARLEGDPDYYDPKIAGWWAWGMSIWIGSGFASGKGPWRVMEGNLVKCGKDREAGLGISRARPHLGHCRGVTRNRDLVQWMQALAARFKRVRVCCGDWRRVCCPVVIRGKGITSVFLDPPYSAEANREDNLYRHESLNVAHEVREWAIANGDNPLLRIALCGYDSEHEAAMPEQWECFAWKSRGRFANRTEGGDTNATRERIWFSPACLKPAEGANGTACITNS